MASSYHLLVAIPDKEPMSFALSGDSVTLGRSPVNDIQILVREVSTNHCKFSLTDNGYEVSDLGSTNGTKLNDRKVTDAVSLNNRDFILLGETIAAYFIQSEEGAEIDMKAEIAEIEKARMAPKKPTVKHLTAPGAVKKVGLPTKKPLVSAPIAAEATPAEGENVGSATIKLAQNAPRPTTKLGAPPVKKLVPPGAPAPVKKLPAATKSPSLTTPPVKKLAPPTPASEPPAATPAAPAVAVTPETVAKPAVPTPPGPAVKKLAAPGLPTKTPSLKQPSPPAKKLTMPAKKVAPKLNLPDKED